MGLTGVLRPELGGDGYRGKAWSMLVPIAKSPSAK